jgi:hypothetical protein
MAAEASSDKTVSLRRVPIHMASPLADLLGRERLLFLG